MADSTTALQDNSQLEQILSQVDDLSGNGLLNQGMDILDANREQFETHNDGIFVKYLTKRGFLSLLKAQWIEARDYFQNANKLIQEHKKEPEWDLMGQQVLIGLGRLSWRQGMYYDAQVYLKRALDLSKKKDAIRATIFIDSANVQADKGELDEAIRNYRHAIKILEPKGASEDLTRAYNNIADTYLQAENYSECVVYADKCVEISTKMKNKRQDAFGLLTGGEALVEMDRTEEARSRVESVKSSYADSEDDYIFAQMYTLLGRVETKEGNYQEALEAYKKGRVLFEKSDIPFYIAKLGHEEGTLYRLIGNLNKAKSSYDAALTIYRENRCLAEIKRIKKDIKILTILEKEASIV